jgi:hypothetical protein
MTTTSKKINLLQLDQELGGHGLIADFNDDKKKVILPAENSPITNDEIAEAIELHIAQPSEDEIHYLNLEQGMAKLKELGFSDDQIKALTSR